MQRLLIFFLCLMVILGMSGCGGSNSSGWQEQYDLGVRYLSEGNYEEAIITFAEVIKINPKCAEAYIGIADAYQAMGDLENAKKIGGGDFAR